MLVTVGGANDGVGGGSDRGGGGPSIGPSISYEMPQEITEKSLEQGSSPRPKLQEMSPRAATLTYQAVHPNDRPKQQSMLTRKAYDTVTYSSTWVFKRRSSTSSFRGIHSRSVIKKCKKARTAHYIQRRDFGQKSLKTKQTITALALLLYIAF